MVFCLCGAEDTRIVEVRRKHLPVIQFLELHVLIHEEDAVFGDDAGAGLHQPSADLCIFGVSIVVGRNGAVTVQEVFLTDLAHIADILNEAVFVKIEGQVDEILQLGEAFLFHGFVELFFLRAEEALHTLCKVVQLVQIDEAVFQMVEFFGEDNVRNEQFGRVIVGCVYLHERRMECGFRAWEVDVDQVVVILYGYFDHWLFVLSVVLIAPRPNLRIAIALHISSNSFGGMRSVSARSATVKCFVPRQRSLAQQKRA